MHDFFVNFQFEPRFLNYTVARYIAVNYRISFDRQPTSAAVVILTLLWEFLKTDKNINPFRGEFFGFTKSRKWIFLMTEN